MKSLFAILLLLKPFCMLAQSEQYLLIGTYTSGKSEGIYVYKFNNTTGECTYVSHAAASNPSYLAVSPDGKFVYAVNEDSNDKGSITAFSFDQKNGTLHLLNKQSTGGDHPCYVSIDNTGRWVFAGNYTGGSVSVIPVMINGSLGVSSVVNHTGSSVDKQRQEKPHVHSTVLSPDNKYVFVPDLGIDKVMTYAFNPGSGKLTPAAVPYTETPPGSGPRHLTFHPSGKFAYLTEEMSATVSAYRYKDGKLSFLQRISSLPAGYNGSKSGADLHVSPDGRFLYASNRGESNTLAIFAIDKKKGTLTIKGHQSALGKTPRNFNFDPSGDFILVANQDSDDIVVFKRDKNTGMLEDTGKRVEISKPVCIKWISN